MELKPKTVIKAKKQDATKKDAPEAGFWEAANQIDDAASQLCWVATRMAKAPDDDGRAGRWAYGLMRRLGPAEKAILRAASGTSPGGNPKSLGPKLTVSERECVISVEIDGALPHSQRPHESPAIRNLKQILEYAFLELPPYRGTKMGRAYLVIETHYTGGTPESRMTDMDNYNVNYLTDLMAERYMAEGDGPGHLAFCSMAMPGDRAYTKATLVRADMFGEWLRGNPEFMRWGSLPGMAGT